MLARQLSQLSYKKMDNPNSLFRDPSKKKEEKILLKIQSNNSRYAVGGVSQSFQVYLENVSVRSVGIYAGDEKTKRCFAVHRDANYVGSRLKECRLGTRYYVEVHPVHRRSVCVSKW